MIPALVSILTFICGLTVLAVGFVNISMMHPKKALMSDSLLHALYLLYMERVRVPYGLFLTLLQLSACLALFYSFFSSSNHFILSLDILFFFSALLLILFHALKLTEIPSAR